MAHVYYLIYMIYYNYNYKKVLYTLNAHQYVCFDVDV